MDSIFRKGDASEAIKARGRFPVTAAGRRWLLLLLVLAAAPAGAHGQTMPSGRGNDVIALVNGAAITRREFQVVYRQAVERHADQGNPVDEAHIAPIRRSVIQTMVEEELLFQESRRMGIEVPAEEIEDKVAEARARFVDAAAFQQDLARRFMDESQYRRMLQRQLARERLLARAVKPASTIAEEDIRRFYTANPQRYQISMEEARPDIHRTLLALKRDGAVRAYIEALREKADIQATD